MDSDLLARRSTAAAGANGARFTYQSRRRLVRQARRSLADWVKPAVVPECADCMNVRGNCRVSSIEIRRHVVTTPCEWSLDDQR